MPDDLTPEALDDLAGLLAAAPQLGSCCILVGQPGHVHPVTVLVEVEKLAALIAAARERDQQFKLAETALGALADAHEVLWVAAGLPEEYADDVDLRDEVVLGLRAERASERSSE